MKLVYVHTNGQEEVLTEVITNHSMSVEDVLELTKFNLEKWANDEDYDYNALATRS